MDQKFDENLVFKNVPASQIKGYERVFEGCRFVSCDLSYADLSQITFINCEMEACNLSLMKITNTGFQNISFHDCKITGVNFNTCSSFSLSVSFTNCLLDYNNFNKKRLKATQFIDCSLKEADFTEADLSLSVFKNCDLDRTIFNRTILKEVDFTSAYNYNIDPENNTMAKAKFSSNALAGLLAKYNLVIE